MKRVASTTSQQFGYPDKIEKTKNKENNSEQITKEKCQKANSNIKLIYIVGWSSSPSSLKTGGSTKVLAITEAWVLAARVPDGDFGWGTPDDLRGLSNRDVREALLFSMDFRIASLSTNFSTLGTTSLGSILHTSVMIHSKAPSIMFFYYEIKSSCLAWRSFKVFSKQAFSSKASAPLKVLISRVSFSSWDRRLWISLFSFSFSDWTLAIAARSWRLWLRREVTYSKGYPKFRKTKRMKEKSIELQLEKDTHILSSLERSIIALIQA